LVFQVNLHLFLCLTFIFETLGIKIKLKRFDTSFRNQTNQERQFWCQKLILNWKFLKNFTFLKLKNIRAILRGSWAAILSKLTWYRSIYHLKFSCWISSFSWKITSVPHNLQKNLQISYKKHLKPHHSGSQKKLESTVVMELIKAVFAA